MSHYHDGQPFGLKAPSHILAVVSGYWIVMDKMRVLMLFFTGQH